MSTDNFRMDRDFRVFLTEDHDGLRAVIRTHLAKHPNIAVVDEASSGAELLDRIATTPANLLCLDFNLKDTTANFILPRIIKVKPRMRVLIVSSLKDTQLVRELISLGASGYLLKDDLVSHLIEAIESILDGNRPWFSPSIPLKGKKEIFLQAQQLKQKSEVIFSQAQILMEKSQSLIEKSMAYLPL